MTDDLERLRLAVIGLGYVGLPVAVAFARSRSVIGFDVDGRRIAELRAGRDRTGEVDAAALAAARGLELTADPARLAAANCYIVTVPTPIDRHRRPDLGPLLRASELVGRALAPGDLVIYESTVYPGCTEEECAPVLERASGLAYCNCPEGGPGRSCPRHPRPFFLGYSPERLNPGDPNRGFCDIVKVTAGSTPAVAEVVDRLYGSVVRAGTHRASSIRVAEAAKVIENTQRDLNIALVNELAMIFNRLGIDTGEVLEAAATKWNFLPFRPGLVGGHCIGVDPYYLTHKAQEVGHHPEVILAGRRINDAMGRYCAGQLLKAMGRRGIGTAGARVLVLGLAFKENCRDLRNSRVVDLIAELADHGVAVEVHDPLVDPDEARALYGIELVAEPPPGRYTTPSSWRWPTAGSANWARRCAPGGARATCSTTSSTSCPAKWWTCGYETWLAIAAQTSAAGGAEGRGMTRTTLVTGAAGFIGFHVARRLLERGDPVVGFDNLNPYYDPALKEARLSILHRVAAATGTPFVFVRADLACREAVERCFADHRFARVIHLAAQAGVRHSLEAPEDYLHSNLAGFLNVLEACRRAHTPHLTYASTSSVYGANAQMPFSEHHPADHPLQFYAATKRANELMAHAYSHLYGLPTTGLRFFTVYGPWGRPDMALFSFTRDILAGRPIRLYNRGRHSRDFTYVDDIVEGVIRASDRVAQPDPQWDGASPDPATSRAPFRIYNIGYGRPVPLTEFVAALERVLGRKAEVELLPLQPGDVPDTWADTRELERATGWRPTVPVEEGVARFVAWYRDYYGV
ncbi:MAG: hypothetical protein KatS3mg124_0699 [Porticoccaceae bacterium]|nr:MAG: hypothetical protein KatS3mg124_0699 [Porticoccaceae bacterium]